MRVDFSRFQSPSDDEIRYVRLARGMRAIAATFIVGGVVVTMFETAPLAPRARPTDATPEDARAYAIAEPHAAMAAAAPAAHADVAAARDSDPALARHDPGRARHG